MCFFRRSGASSRAPANRRPSPAHQVKMPFVCACAARVAYVLSFWRAGDHLWSQNTNYTSFTRTQTNSLTRSLTLVSDLALIVVVLVPVSDCLSLSLIYTTVPAVPLYTHIHTLLTAVPIVRNCPTYTQTRGRCPASPYTIHTLSISHSVSHSHVLQRDKLGLTLMLSNCNSV